MIRKGPPTGGPFSVQVPQGDQQVFCNFSVRGRADHMFRNWLLKRPEHYVFESIRSSGYSDRNLDDISAERAELFDHGGVRHDMVDMRSGLPLHMQPKQNHAGFDPFYQVPGGAYPDLSQFLRYDFESSVFCCAQLLQQMAHKMDFREVNIRVQPQQVCGGFEKPIVATRVYAVKPVRLAQKIGHLQHA